MATAQSSATFDLSTPRTNSSIRPEQSPNEPIRSSRRRRFTAPAYLQLSSAAQALKKPKMAQSVFRDDVKIVGDVDELIPRLQAVGKDPSLYTPPTTAFDSAFVPFVLDNGLLSFYTPTESTESSDPEHSASLPTSAVSTSFSPYEYYGTQHNEPILEDLFIWRGDDDGPSHIYAQMLDPSPTCETIPLKSFDPSIPSCGPVRVAGAHPSCQFMHVDIPLMTPPPTALDKDLSNNSLIAIASPRRFPSRLLTTVYNRGTPVSSHEVQMEERDPQYSDLITYSAPFPQDFIDELCDEVDCIDEKNSVSSPGVDRLDSVVVMQFVQQEDPSAVGETMLVMTAEFQAVKSPSPAGVKISYFSLDNNPPQESHSSKLSSGEPPVKPAMASKSFRRARVFGRLAPKLSVSIPPPSTHGVNGIELYTESPDSAVRRTPQVGVPSSVLPITPTGHTPLSSSSTASSNASSASSYGPTPSESDFPFTLSSTSAAPAQSPTLSTPDLDSHLASAPAWLTLPRHMTPFTPSFFMHPHTATGSNTMTAATRTPHEFHEFDAGPSPYHIEEYFDQSITSPPPVTPSLSLPSGHTSESSVLEEMLQWSL